MKFAVLVATFGDDSWRKRGSATAAHVSQNLSEDPTYAGVYAFHGPDGTLAEARNHAARAVTAEWLVFLDADDELEQGYLAAFAHSWFECAVLEDWAPLLVPSVRYVHRNGRSEPPRIPQEGRWPELNECVIGTGIRRDLFLAIGGFRELPSLEDYDLWLRAYDAGASLVYARDAVYRATVNPDGRNRDQSPYDGIWRDHLDRIAVVENVSPPPNDRGESIAANTPGPDDTLASLALDLFPTYDYERVGFWRSLWLVLRGHRIEVFSRVA